MKEILIKNVVKDSIAEELGICQGDYLLNVNNEEIIDILDYKFHMSDEFVTIEINHNGEITEYEIEKEIYEDIGLIFENELIDNPKRCMNKCIFCFMDQLPDNMRNTLVFKDDDYRLSFLTGNYVTLTNCTENDIDRIIKYRLSPINISVHTTNQDMRKQMLNNKNAAKILEHIQKLYDSQIYMNGQIVLCPGYNDKEQLVNTLMDLSKFYPYMQSISIVPVGLTKFRKKLHKLRTFTSEEMKSTIRDVEMIQKRFKKKYGSNIVYLSDEFYLKANEKLPEYVEYEDFPQLENGVGMVTLFMQQFNDRLKKIKKKKENTFQKVSVITGKLFCPYMKKCADILNEKFGTNILVYDIENNFFGKEITVTGLITAQDIIKQIKNKDIDEKKVYICDVMLKQDEDIFLDNMSVKELSDEIKKEIVILENNGEVFIDEMLKTIKKY